jgi:hypothetical protein
VHAVAELRHTLALGVYDDAPIGVKSNFASEALCKQSWVLACRALAHRSHRGLRKAERRRRARPDDLGPYRVALTGRARLAESLTAGTMPASGVLRVTQGGGTPTLFGRRGRSIGRTLLPSGTRRRTSRTGNGPRTRPCWSMDGLGAWLRTRSKELRQSAGLGQGLGLRRPAATALPVALVGYSNMGERNLRSYRRMQSV